MHHPSILGNGSNEHKDEGTRTGTSTSRRRSRSSRNPTLTRLHQFLRLRSSEERGKPLMTLFITLISDC
jgi:hypothetical protein